MRKNVMRRREHDGAVEENSMERKAYCYDNGCPINENTRSQYLTHLMGAFKSLSTAPFGRHIIRSGNFRFYQEVAFEKKDIGISSGDSY